jgi:hypothetical protein
MDFASYAKMTNAETPPVLAHGVAFCVAMDHWGIFSRCFERVLSPNPEKTNATHHHLNVPPRRPAHHRERAVVGLDPHATVGPGVIPERRARASVSAVSSACWSEQASVGRSSTTRRDRAAAGVTSATIRAAMVVNWRMASPAKLTARTPRRSGHRHRCVAYLGNIARVE